MMIKSNLGKALLALAILLYICAVYVWVFNYEYVLAVVLLFFIGFIFNIMSLVIR